MNKDISININTATIDNISDILNLRRYMFESMGIINEEELNDMIIESEKYFLDKIPKKLYLGWIAENNSKETVGTLGLVIDHHPPSPDNLSGKIGYIMNLAVYSEYQRQGIATKLLSKCFEWLKDHNISLISLHASDEGISLYQNLGFLDTTEMRLKLL